MAQNTYISGGQLRACKKGLNCVSTNPASKKSRLIQPFRYKKEIYPAALKEMLVKFVKATFNSNVLKYGDAYLHFEIRSNIFNFRSDLEILMVPEKKEVHFRSCSRIAIWDLESNRRRINKIRRFLHKSLQSRDNLDN